MSEIPHGENPLLVAPPELPWDKLPEKYRLGEAPNEKVTLYRVDAATKLLSRKPILASFDPYGVYDFLHTQIYPLLEQGAAEEVGLHKFLKKRPKQGDPPIEETVLENPAFSALIKTELNK